jgi:hypothetical protein
LAKARPCYSFIWHVYKDGPRPLSGEEWLKLCLSPCLNRNVPIEVIRLFEVARGAFAYGSFFYPMYSLASQQLYRVVDTATLHKCCKENVVEKDINTFKKRLDWLFEHGFLPPDDRARWNASRKLRNHYSHPENQTIISPTMALEQLRMAVDEINQLFPV